MQTMPRESWTDERLESMQRTMIFGVISLSSAFIAGFAAVVTKI